MTQSTQPLMLHRPNECPKSIASVSEDGCGFRLKLFWEGSSSACLGADCPRFPNALALVLGKNAYSREDGEAPAQYTPLLVKATPPNHLPVCPGSCGETCTTVVSAPGKRCSKHASRERYRREALRKEAALKALQEPFGDQPVPNPLAVPLRRIAAVLERVEMKLEAIEKDVSRLSNRLIYMEQVLQRVRHSLVVDFNVEGEPDGELFEPK